jgi:hypothetical protein
VTATKRPRGRTVIRGSYEVLKAERSSYHCKSRRADQAELKKRIKEIAEARDSRYGYRRIHVLLVREGWPVNGSAHAGSTARRACNCAAKHPSDA